MTILKSIVLSAAFLFPAAAHADFYYGGSSTTIYDFSDLGSIQITGDSAEALFYKLRSIHGSRDHCGLDYVYTSGIACSYDYDLRTYTCNMAISLEDGEVWANGISCL